MNVSGSLRRACSRISLVLFLSLVASLSWGQPIIEEAFDYDPGNLNGRNGGTGWASPWSVGIQAGVTGSVEVVENSLSFSNYETTGNRLNLTNMSGSGFLGLWGERFVSQSVLSGELWASFLYRRTDDQIGISTVSRTAEIRVNTSPIHFGLKAKGPSSQGIVVRYEGSDGPSAATTSVQDGNTYLMVGRFTNLGTTDMSGVGTMWALTESNYNSIATGGVTPEELDSAATLIASDTTNVSDPKDLQIGDPIWILNFTSAYPFAFDVDELRYGTSLADVVPGSAAIIGDHNGDGLVDAADYVVWRKNDGTPVGYDDWRANFGAGLGSGSRSHVSVVPEPVSWVLCLAAMTALLPVRRRCPRFSTSMPNPR